METKPKHFLLATDLTSRSTVALRRAARLAAEGDGDLTVLSVIERGLPPKIVTRRMAVIRNAVERLGPDLLALGANSRSGLAENFIGSTTREFLVYAPCDILVAHVPG